MNTSLRAAVLTYAQDYHAVTPEYLWPEEAPGYAVLRHPGRGKWYGVVMDVPFSKLGLPGEGRVDVLNIKCDPDTLFSLVGSEGFLPAYHMHKGHWMTVLLDGTVPEGMVLELLERSYEIIASRGRGRR